MRAITHDKVRFLLGEYLVVAYGTIFLVNYWPCCAVIDLDLGVPAPLKTGTPLPNKYKLRGRIESYKC